MAVGRRKPGAADSLAEQIVPALAVAGDTDQRPLQLARDLSSRPQPAINVPFDLRSTMTPTSGDAALVARPSFGSVTHQRYRSRLRTRRSVYFGCMRLDYEVVINKPIEDVWDYTNDRDNLELWLNDFVRYEQVTGDSAAPKVGDTCNMTYSQGKGEFTMLEEIVDLEKPSRLKMFMSCNMFDMEIVNTFEAIDEGKTRLFAGANFVRLGLMMKVVFLFSSEKKQLAEHKRQIDKLKELIEAS